MATTWLCRASVGNDNYGGTSSTLLASAGDGVTNGTNTMTSAMGAFTSALLGQAVALYTGGTTFLAWRMITAVNSATSLTLSGATLPSNSTITYYIGGPLKNLTRLLGFASTPFSAGDTVYLGAGHYHGQVIVQVAGVVGTPTTVAGDVSGVYTGDAGETVVSCYSTGDASGSTYALARSASTITFNGLAADYYIFQDLTVIAPIISTLADSNNFPPCAIDLASNQGSGTTGQQGITIQRCAIYGPTTSLAGITNGGGIALASSGTSGAAVCSILNCSFFLPFYGVASPANPMGAWNQTLFLTCLAGIIACCQSAKPSNLVIKNCFFLAPQNGNNTTTPNSTNSGVCGILFVQSGGGTSSSSFAGSVIAGCTFITPTGICGSSYAVFANTTTVTGCVFFTTTGPILGSQASAYAGIALSNSIAYGAPFISGTVNTGMVESNTRPPFFDIGQAFLRRGPAPPFFAPLPSASFVGLGPRSTALTSDFGNQSRQQNTASTVRGTPGYAEPVQPGQQESNATKVHSGTFSLRLTGYQTHCFQFPVDVGVTSLQLFARYDSSYGTPGTDCDFPMISVRDGASCGVADQDVAMNSTSSDAWQQLNVNVTATRKGIVTVQLVSRASTASGLCWFDD